MLAAVSFADEAWTPQPGSFRQRRGGISRTGSEAHCLWLQSAVLTGTWPWASPKTSKPHFFTFNTWEVLFNLGVVVRMKAQGDLHGAWLSVRAPGTRLVLVFVQLSEASWSVLLKVHTHVLRHKTGAVRLAWGWSEEE